MTTCNNCGSQNPAEHIYCTACGRMLDADDDKTLVIAGQSAGRIAAAGGTTAATQRPSATLAPLNPAPGWSGQRERLLVLIDISSSMGENFDGNAKKLDAAIRGARNLITNKAQIDPDDEVGLIKFNHLPTTCCYPHPIRTHKASLLEALQRLRAFGGTDIGFALRTARDKLDRPRPGVVQRIVMLSDGHSNDEPGQDDPVEIAQSLKAARVVIDAIGIGSSPSDVDERRMRLIASSVGGESCYRFISDQRTLLDHYTNLANKTQVG